MEHHLLDKAKNILSRTLDLSIATLRPDGWPQATVVSFVHDGLLIYFGCGPNSQKAVNLARDPRVSVTVTPPYKDWYTIQGLSLAGQAREVTNPAEAQTVYKMMGDRFPQLGEMADLQEVAAMQPKLFCIRPEILSVLDYSLGFGHTDLVRVDP